MEELIKELLAETIEDDSGKESWTKDTDILNGIGLDSLQLVSFLLKLEDRLDIVLDYDSLQFEDLASIGALEEYLKRCVAEKDAKL